MIFRRKEYTEAQLVKGCVKNKREYQEVLYARYFGKMMQMCMRYTRDEDKAIEIINDGFLKVFRKIDQFSGKGSLEGWIRKIVYHSISDHFKKESRYLKFIVLEEYKKQNTTRAEALENLYYDDIIDMVDSLPRRCREVFTHFAIDGMNHQEISDHLGISIGTSKWHLSEARKKLRAIIESRMQHYHAG